MVGFEPLVPPVLGVVGVSSEESEEELDEDDDDDDVGGVVVSAGDGSSAHKIHTTFTIPTNAIICISTV